MSAIVGIGIDVVEVERVARMARRYGSTLLEKLFSQGERDHLALHPPSSESLAGRIAAKEATFKALGTGWSQGLSWTEVELLRATPRSRPEVRLRGRAALRAETLGVRAIHVSITHDAGIAAAVVVLERGA